jgi:hypothetical protein
LRVLRRLSVYPREGKNNEGWRNVRNKERHNYFAVNSNRLKCEGRVIKTEELRDTNTNFVRRPKGKMSYERGVLTGG